MIAMHVLFCIFALLLSSACVRRTTAIVPIASTPINDSNFLDAAISLGFPKDWSVSESARLPNSDVQEEGVTIQKGSFVVSAKGETILQASGVDGGRIYEYLRSTVVDVACLWKEGVQLQNSSETKLPNGITMRDFYLDPGRLSSTQRRCL